ncbi:hypothetical protein CYMTET_18360 [Cymbomonas tetramitiformis]|uniref:RING-type domain-containing protein n=1 Tax=Cymbomonas tetramitiformis TaxID=36881 RepID=A0AAE0G9L1_9CHLO|nr:hypothetical protein CYMTET_18360 [Cymbomonas tetramitiformis]
MALEPPNKSNRRRSKRADHARRVTHRRDRADSLRPICNEEILAYEKLYFGHATLRTCRNIILAAVLPSTPTFLTDPPLDSLLDADAMQDLTQDIGVFCTHFIENLIVMGFCVYTVVPRVLRDSADFRDRADDVSTRPPLMRVYALKPDEQYALRVGGEGSRDAITIQKNTHDSLRTLFTQTQASTQNSTTVTFSTIKDRPCTNTGRLRSDVAGVYATVCFEQSVVYSSMISDRTRAQPVIFTRSRTDNAFDERNLITLNSDRRAISAMDNMQARNQIAANLHHQQNVENSSIAQSNGGDSTFTNTLHPCCQLTQDPLRMVQRAPALLPLPVDTELAVPPMATGRTDMVQLLKKVHEDILFAFGLQLYTRSDSMVSVGCQDQHGNFPLHVAMMRDEPEIAKTLLQYGAKIDERNYEGQTALHLACYQGNARVAQLVIDRYDATVVNVDRVGNSVLHYAARCETDICVLVCLRDLHACKIRDCVELRNNFGMTALHVAAEHANIKVIRTLRRFGADPSSLCGRDCTAIDLCARITATAPPRTVASSATDAASVKSSRVIECIRALRGMGVPLRTDRTTALHTACRAARMSVAVVQALMRMDPTLRNAVDTDGFTPIMLAARRRDHERGAGSYGRRRRRQHTRHNVPLWHEVLRVAASGCIFTNACDHLRRTCHHYAALTASYAVAEAVMHALSRLLPCVDSHGATPLHLAVQSACDDAVVLPKLVLYADKLDIDARTMIGNTALHLAVMQRQHERATQLLQLGADVDICNLDAESALTLAVREGDANTVRAMYARHQQGKAFRTNVCNESPVHVAARAGNVVILEVLIVDRPTLGRKLLNQLNRESCTPLHCAIVAQQVAAVKLLIDHGADVHVRDRNDDDAAQLAAATRNAVIATMIQNAPKKTFYNGRSRHVRPSPRVNQNPTTTPDNNAPEDLDDLVDYIEGRPKRTRKTSEQRDTAQAVRASDSERYERPTCVVCLNADPDTVLMPCFHMHTCSACSARVGVCPICKTAVHDKRRVFKD